MVSVSLGCNLDSFTYRKATGDTDGVPWVVEVAFRWCPDLDGRGMATGVNWSPALINPFRLRRAPDRPWARPDTRCP
jgi:hypothetical protein